MENSIKSKWNEIINHVKDEYNVSNLLFRTWLLPLTVFSEHNNQVLIIIDEEKQGSAPDIISNKYKMPLTVAIEEITGRQVDIDFILSKDISKYDNTSDEVSSLLLRKYPYLNSGHSFHTFVVSSSNSMAHAASLAVAENPAAQVYNPLFLYGNSGLGKTHLMHSIARYIIEADNKLKVMYVTSEVFTNEVIEAIRFNRTKGDSSATAALKEKYRNVDILLIDDIQFIIGKESTQEEFFHTFNTLYESGKQIVISSDKPPKDMELLDERFRSRFEQGIIVDIQPPDYETSMAILQKICDTKNIKIDNSILDYIATNIKSNVRSLEGALNVIVLYTGLKHNTVDLEMAKELLRNQISPDHKAKITIDYILDIVADHFHIEKSLILSTRKTNDIVLPRQLCMFLCKELTNFSFKEIGSALGGRDHSTVIHGVNKIMEKIEVDEILKNSIDVIKKKLNA